MQCFDEKWKSLVLPSEHHCYTLEINCHSECVRPWKDDSDLFDSSAGQSDPRKTYHISMTTGHAIDMLESDFLYKFLSLQLESAKPMKFIPEITWVECVQKIGNDCVLHVLKNVEHCINTSDLLIINASDSFTVDAKHWYETSDTTDLRIKIISVLRESTTRSKLEGTRVGRTTRQKRKSCK